MAGQRVDLKAGVLEYWSIGVLDIKTLFGRGSGFQPRIADIAAGSRSHKVR
jgi:hypothetical protein